MSEVIAFPNPLGYFDAHAWIRAVEAAGGELRLLPHDSWSIAAAGDQDGRYGSALCNLLAQVGGQSIEALAKKGAVRRALSWRDRR